MARYETFSASEELDARYDSGFDRCLSDEWHECEAVEVEYECPAAAKLIDSMEENWTPRTLREVANEMRAHRESCPFCRGERKPVESQQAAIPGETIRVA